MAYIAIQGHIRPMIVLRSCAQVNQTPDPQTLDLPLLSGTQKEAAEK
jgi:hypothetical protein